MSTDQDKKDVMLLVGDFTPSVLDRWLAWGATMGYTIERKTMDEVNNIKDYASQLMIMDSHALNDADLSDLETRVAVWIDDLVNHPEFSPSQVYGEPMTDLLNQVCDEYGTSHAGSALKRGTTIHQQIERLAIFDDVYCPTAEQVANLNQLREMCVAARGSGKSLSLKDIIRAWDLADKAPKTKWMLHDYDPGPMPYIKQPQPKNYAEGLRLNRGGKRRRVW